jgi:S1-C subfamily serine protease
MLNLQEQHEKCLYPEVRIQAEKARGSGTILYSAPIPGEGDRHETYVITNAHVVDDLITVKKEWSNLLQREIKKDILGTPMVETFEYDFVSRVIGGTTYQSDIVCYDKVEDLALLRVRTPRPFPYVATMYPRDRIEELRCFMPVVNVGCGLGNKPVITFGYISGFGYEIENKDFMLISAPSIFGNSGGATFLDSGKLVGIPARVSVIFIGWSADPIPHLSYSIPIWRVYDFLEAQIFSFIYDPAITSVECEERRQEERKREELKLLRTALQDEEKPGAGVKKKYKQYGT